MGVALDAGANGVVWEGWGVNLEACRAEGLRMEAEDAGGAETTEDAAVADLVEQPPLLRAAITTHRRRRHGRR